MPNATNNFYLSQKITTILLNNNFWEHVTKIQEILLPYCDALNKLQSNTTCLYNVLQPIYILLELEAYRKRLYPFNFLTCDQFGDNVLGFWEFVNSATKELGPLALCLFGICVNAA
ncbi:2240_t:CDS:2, partial [Dentiscutata erythropus]